MTLGTRLKQLREERNITRKELSNLMNITYSSLSKYETNERFPEKELLVRLADYFDVSLDYLLGRSNARKTNEPLNSAFHSISTEGLEEKDIEMVKAMVERLKESHNSNQ